MVAAILLWLFAIAVDRRTEVQIHSIGGRIELEVAGTTLSAPIVIEALTAVEIRAMDSVDPPGGGRITITGDHGAIVDERLPRRFRFPLGQEVPVGDWELDESAGRGTVWRHALVVSGVFTVDATFRGRFHHDLEVVLHGVPGASVAIRRGLINHDVFIRSADGTTLAVTSIDPTPAADLGATAATLLRAAALASLLIALFALLESMSHPSPKPAASRRWRAAPWAVLLAASAVTLSTWVAWDVLEGLPHLPDSVTYLLQAKWLLAGDLWGSVSALQDYLDVPYTYVVGDQWLGHYPPGWPLLLSRRTGHRAPRRHPWRAVADGPTDLRQHAFARGGSHPDPRRAVAVAGCATAQGIAPCRTLGHRPGPRLRRPPFVSGGHGHSARRLDCS
jgi:hypothetical protein